MLQMSTMMRDAGFGAGGFGLPPSSASSSFPAPGSPSTNSSLPFSAATPTSDNPTTTGTNPPLNPFALFGGFPVPATGAGNVPPGATTGAPGANSTPGLPFNPALMQQMFGLGAFGGPGAGGLGTYGAPAPPSDTRPPEERFQVQLQQLQDMGFTNASQNIRALLATGGNVHSAIEYILSGGGL